MAERSVSPAARACRGIAARRSPAKRTLCLCASVPLCLLSILATAGESTPPTPPAWAGFTLPEPGFRKNVSINVMKDVWQGVLIDGRGEFSDMMTNWAGGAFSADYSQYGAMILKGGGHGSYQSSDLYVFDLTTRRFERILDTWPAGHKPPGADWIYGPCGPYATPDGKKMYANVLQAYHTYDTVQVVPANAGGGPKGTVVYTHGSNGPANRAVDLANPGSGQWVFATAEDPVRPTAPPGYFHFAKDPPKTGGEVQGCTSWDPKRKLIWVAMGGAGVYRISTEPRAWSEKICESTIHLRAGFATMQYSPAHDILVVVGGNNDADKYVPGSYRSWHWLDCQDPKAGFKAIKGKFPNGEIQNKDGSGGLQWYPPLNRFIYYRGMKSTRVLHIIPPAGSDTNRALLTSGEWTTEVEEIASTKPGAPPAGDDPVVIESAAKNGCYQRFAYVPALKCFLWVDSVAKPAQLWRLNDARPRDPTAPQGGGKP
jgi:hypothetical protein